VGNWNPYFVKEGAILLDTGLELSSVEDVAAMNIDLSLFKTFYLTPYEQEAQRELWPVRQSGRTYLSQQT